LTLSVAGRLALVAAGIWQFVSWGGRISLLTDAEAVDPWNWFRIGGSLAVGAAVLAVGIGLVRRPVVAIVITWAYLLVGLATWSRSLFGVWSEPNTLGFRLVHTALALATWTLGVVAVAVVRRSASRVPVAASR
jgi:hypothetical protein